jgi:hypothetical protein
VAKTFVERLVQALEDAVRAELGELRATRARSAPSAGARSAKGQRRDMRCRSPRCKRRSKGPRFRFLCEEHLELSRKRQDAALARWAKRS